SALPTAPEVRCSSTATRVEGRCNSVAAGVTEGGGTRTGVAVIATTDSVPSARPAATVGADTEVTSHRRDRRSCVTKRQTVRERPVARPPIQRPAVATEERHGTLGTVLDSDDRPQAYEFLRSCDRAGHSQHLETS